MENQFEKVLNEINTEKVQLNPDKTKRINARVEEVLDVFIRELKKDNLFKFIYNRIFFGGSYYDELKVGEPDEFDIDLVLTFPKLSNPTIDNDDQKPGYVEVKVPGLDRVDNNNYCPDFKQNFAKCLLENGVLNIKKMMTWFQSVVDKAVNRMDFDRLSFEIVDISKPRGPAITLQIKDTSTYMSEYFDLDLVPCFKLDANTHWPANFRDFNSFKFLCSEQITQEFFVIPKYKNEASLMYFRLSFQGQERHLIKHKGHLKPAIRLLKLYRDVHNSNQDNHYIKSYFIKTVALWALEDDSFVYINKPLSVIFLQLLERLIKMVEKQNLPYYWNERFNLFADHKPDYLRGLLSRLQKDKELFTSPYSKSCDIKIKFGCIDSLVIHSYQSDRSDVLSDSDSSDEFVESVDRLRINNTDNYPSSSINWNVGPVVRRTYSTRAAVVEETEQDASNGWLGPAVIAVGAAAILGIEIFAALRDNQRRQN